MTDNVVLQEQRGAVRLITLNRPETLNAWNDALEDAYFDALQDADDEPRTRAIVVTGAGRGFCSGADMDLLQGVLADGVDAPPADRRPRSLPYDLRTPVIAAVNGAAAGLGLVQALYCDLRFTTPTAKFTTAFARRGLIAEYGCAWLLVRTVGQSRALDLLLSGRVITGQEALAMGLVDRVFAPGDLVEAAVAYANELAALSSPASMATIKQQVHSDAAASFADAYEASLSLMDVSLAGPDLAEGVASYLEARPPAFPPLPPGTST